MKESKITYNFGNDRGIDLLRLLRVLWKWKYAVLIVALVVGTLSFMHSKFFVAPSYRSSFTAYVNNRLNTENQNITSSSDLTASRSLAYLYQDIITSRSVLTDAAESCDLNYSYSTLKQMVSSSISESTAMISVYVDSQDPAISTQLAMAISAVAPEHVARVVDGSSMRIVDSPIMPQAPFAPNSMENALTNALIAMCITAVVMVVLDLVTDKVNSSSEMEERYGIVVVGTIPDLAHAEKQTKVYGADHSRRYQK